MLQKINYFLWTICCLVATAQAPLLSHQTDVSILTVGTANTSHSLYGHTALRIKDNNFDLVYNYGMFDFSTPNFALKFVKGDMQYFAAAYDYYHFENNYRAENRTIWEQKLNLTPEQKNQLFASLNASLQGQEKYYTYKFIDRNCTTKVLDQINQIIAPETIIKGNVNNDISYREVLNTYLSEVFFLKLGINIMFGAKTDQPATTIFLPDDLMHNLESAKVNDQALAQPTTTLFKAQKIATNSLLDNLGVLMIVLLAIILPNKKWLINSFIIFQGVLGIFLLSMSLYSLHNELHYNYNVLLFNPLYILLALLNYQKSPKTKKIIWIAITTMLAAYTLMMINKAHLSFMWPFILVNFFVLKNKFKN